ncbi:AMP-binding protein [Streptomyces sp. RB6PN25]|uniref:AMP-binding protein n=1 Tax=Streptomyces humicola TaxID=2953240 RepID=A0ABT1PTU8_9ACTN|nr:AMP-binding protein [Streptomyces humicola]MCQ4081086.1 AMP-binding protein [Streptomyces humicola]
MTPDRPAVVESAGIGRVRVTSYRDLRLLVDTYTSHLRDLGIGIGERIILEADVTAQSIAMLLACSAAGLTFIPVSPETPAQRLHSMISTARPALHVQPTDGKRDALPGGVGTARFDTAGITVVERPPTGRSLRREACVTDPAYMIFTSGTTGRPKGVVMSHRAVVSFYRAMLEYRIVTPRDRVASTSPLQFDFSLLNIGLALGSGAAVVPVAQQLVRWPRNFLRVLRETGATQVNGVPSIWQQALRYEPEKVAALDGLRGILFCGEEFPLPELRRIRELLPQVRIINCYGATESMACSFADVPDPLPDDLERLSIGSGHRGAELLLVNEAGHVIDEPGVPGELYLRSPALFSGYWDDPAATRAALVPDPLCPQSGQLVLRTGDVAYRGHDGELYFCGRSDSQVQINGNRVELGEVERRLLEFPGATAAAAVPLPHAASGTVLGGFVVVSNDAPAADAASLREFCADRLPSYMVPREIRLVETLPTTTNGKVDRAALISSAATAGETGEERNGELP